MNVDRMQWLLPVVSDMSEKMKNSMSNIDIYVIINEMRSAIEGAFVKNVYQYGDVFVLKLYQQSGSSPQLLLQPGCRIHLTEFKRVAPRQPSKFISVLRKYLRDKRILSIRQHQFDRVVIIEIGDVDSSYKLVLELFSHGNLLLLDPQDRIFVALHYRRMRDRDVLPKALYVFPPPRGVDILSINDPTMFDNLLFDSTASVVKTLISRLNLDALSCEEICALARIATDQRAVELNVDERQRLVMAINHFGERVRNGVKHPRLVFQQSDDVTVLVAFVPFEFELYKNLPYREFTSFSSCIDEYFGVFPAEMAEDNETEVLILRERERLQTIVDRQTQSMEELLSKAQEQRRIGELIYSNFQTIQEILDVVNKARSGGLSWSEIISRIEQGKARGMPSASIIQSIEPSTGQICVSLDGTEVRLDIRLSAQDNAAKAFDMAKKWESKAEGAKKQIEQTQVRLDELTRQSSVPTVTSSGTPLKVRKKKWYERYRWFVSSEGHLVIAGRDRKSNEHLTKRHMDSSDIFLHASIHGAPYTIIKVTNGPPGELTIREAAQFAVSFSRAWQDGLSSGDAYWVLPEQVSFSPPSGEYLPAGAVMIYGTKNYVHDVPVEIAVGILFEDDTAILFSGPPSAVESKTPYSIRILPGPVKKGQLAKDIIVRLKAMAQQEDKSALVDRIPEEDLMQVLPPGDGRIV